MDPKEEVSASGEVAPVQEDKDKRNHEEEEEAAMGTAVAKVGVFAMIIGIFLHILKMLRGRPKSKSN